jgi:hypothetical protein
MRSKMAPALSDNNYHAIPGKRQTTLNNIMNRKRLKTLLHI